MVIYITVPGTSFWSIFQSHPFIITWWQNDDKGRAITILVLIKKRVGFTCSLLEHLRKHFISWLDNPYGIVVNLSGYNQILMVAFSARIVAQISYICKLLNAREQLGLIFIIWEIDQKGMSLILI